MRRYERFSTLLTFNRPVGDWEKLLSAIAAVAPETLAVVGQSVWRPSNTEGIERRLTVSK